MKKILSKLLISLMIVILISNYAISPVRAADDQFITDCINVLEDILGTIAGLLTYPERLVVIWAGDILQSITAAVAYIDGADPSVADKSVITPFEILFNKVTIVNVNVFDKKLTGDGAISGAFRKGIATWFYAFRNIAVVILFVVLLYVGIRMAISTVASERARYQKMITDWVVSLALIFLMQYIAIFTLTVNDALVQGIQGVSTINLSNAVEKLKLYSYNPLGGIKSIGAAFVYALLMWQTMSLFFTYFKRMLKICFLIVISPLVTLTYSIDKMGDGKAQAFNTWLKELIFGILIQPFHCAIYMAFVSMSLKMVTPRLTNLNNFNTGLAACLVAILGIQFIKPAEQIVRKIFAFKDDSSMTSLAAGAAMAAFAFQSSGKIAKTGVKGIKFAKQLPQNIKNAKKALSTEGGAFLAAMSAGSSGTGGTTEGSEESAPDPDKSQSEFKESGGAKEVPKTFSERFAAEKKKREMEYDKKVADRLKEKELGKDGDSHEDADERYKDEIDKETEAIVNASGGAIDHDTAHQAARRKVFEKYAKDRRVVRSAIAKNETLRNVRQTAERISGLETFKLGKDLAKDKIASGIGLFSAAGALSNGQNIVTAGLTGMAAAEATGIMFTELQKDSVAESSKEKDLIDAFQKRDDYKGNEQAINLDTVEDNRYDTGKSECKNALEELSKKLDDLLKRAGVEDAGTRQKILNKVSNQDALSSPSSAFKTVPADVRRMFASATKDTIGSKPDDERQAIEREFSGLCTNLKQQYAGMALHEMVSGENGRTIREIQKSALAGDNTLGASLERIYQSYKKEQAFAAAIQHIDEDGMKGRIMDAKEGVKRTDTSTTPPPSGDAEDVEVVDEREAEGRSDVAITDLATAMKDTIEPHRMRGEVAEMNAPAAEIDHQKSLLTESGQGYVGDGFEDIISNLQERQQEIYAKNAEVLASYFRLKSDEVKKYDEEAFRYAQSHIDATIDRLNILIQQRQKEMSAEGASEATVARAKDDIDALETRLKWAEQFKNGQFTKGRKK